MHSDSWAIIAHGGAKDIEPQDEERNRDGLHKAIYVGGRILAGGGTALDAVEEVVKLLENDPTYNAGLFGSALNEDGNIELTASIMDGSTLDIGAVAGLKRYLHPIMVARALLRDKAIFLIGEGAMKFAKAQGFTEIAAPSGSNTSMGCDTVGCVARDQRGNLAVATSTGGLKATRAGRVSDVPLPGCGFYADNNRGAVSCSGEGEAIARVLLAGECLNLFKTMSGNEAAKEAIKLIEKLGAQAGIIGITHEGHITWAHNSVGFAVGMAWAESPDPKTYVKRDTQHA